MTYILKNYFQNFWIIIKFYYKSGSEHFLDEALQSSSSTFMLLASMVIFYFSKTLNNEIITYLLIGNLVYVISNPRIDWILGNIIRDHKLTNYIMPPTSIFKHFIGYGIANAWFGFLISSISAVPLILIFFYQITLNGLSLKNFIIFLLCIIFSLLFRVALQMIIAFSTFWTKEVAGSVAVSINIELFLAGTLSPLSILTSILPENMSFLAQVIYLQPLAFIIYHPMQIILGNYNLIQALFTLLGCILWTIILWLIAIILYKYARKSQEIEGI
jgi:ABC-type uncharacterized transport system permease subunit